MSVKISGNTTVASVSEHAAVLTPGVAVVDGGLSADDATAEIAAQEYAAFLAKFEAKKTTDECFTPPEVFAAVHRWAEAEYGLQGRRIVRPFYPGGDFVTFDYQPGDVVLDNPPFSILTKIRRFYDARGIDYFMFAPALTLFSVRAPTMLVVAENIVYANGATVPTSFITSLEPSVRVRTAPTLARALRSLRQVSVKLPKYIYPLNVRNAATIQKIADVEFSIGAHECEFIAAMDAQRDEQKTIFGCGVIMSDAKASELKAAELKAAERVTTVDCLEWQLSQREHDIIARLNEGKSDALDSRPLQEPLL